MEGEKSNTSADFMEQDVSFVNATKKANFRKTSALHERVAQFKNDGLRVNKLQSGIEYFDSVDSFELQTGRTSKLVANSVRKTNKLEEVQGKHKRPAEESENGELKRASLKQARTTIPTYPSSPKKQKESSALVESANGNVKLRENLQHVELTITQHENELEKVKHTLKGIMQTNVSLHQKLIELEKKKQGIITEFHQFYRRVNNILRQQSKIEEQFDEVTGFLDHRNSIKEAVSSVTGSWTKLLQLWKVFENYREKLENVKWSSHQSVQAIELSILEMSIEEPKESEILALNFDGHIALCQEKGTLLQTRSNNLRAEIDNLEADIASLKTSVECERDQMKTNIITLAQEIRYEMKILRNETNSVNQQTTREISSQKEIIKSLQDKLNRRKIKLDQLTNEQRILEEGIEGLSVKQFEAKEKLSCTELEFRELNDSLAELMNLVNQEKTCQADVQSSIQIKAQEFEELQEKLSLQVAEKEDLIGKLNRCRSIDDHAKKLSQLQSALAANAQQEQKLKEIISSLRNDEKAKESHINDVKVETKVVQEKILKLQTMQAVHSGSQSHEVTNEIPYSDFLKTILLVKGSEASLCDAKELELSSVCDDILESVYAFVELEQHTEQINRENDEFDTLTRSKKNLLEKVLDEIMKLHTHEKTIRLLVKEGRYTTKQELNKSYAQLIQYKEAEELVVNTLKAELEEDKLELAARMKYYQDMKQQEKELGGQLEGDNPEEGKLEEEIPEEKRQEENKVED